MIYTEKWLTSNDKMALYKGNMVMPSLVKF